MKITVDFKALQYYVIIYRKKKNAIRVSRKSLGYLYLEVYFLRFIMFKNGLVLLKNVFKSELLFYNGIVLY